MEQKAFADQHCHCELLSKSMQGWIVFSKHSKHVKMLVQRAVSHWQMSMAYGAFASWRERSEILKRQRVIVSGENSNQNVEI